MPNCITCQCLMLNFIYIEQQMWNIRTGTSLPYQEKYGFHCSDGHAKFLWHLQYGILSKSNNAENRGEISLTPLSKDGFQWADFQWTHSWSTAIVWRSIPNFTHVCHAIRKVRTDIVYPSAKHAFTKHIFTTLSTARQLFVKNVYTEFHENLTNGVDADTRSRTKGHGLQIRRSFFTL